jgi:mannose-6-phosphate isomerase-like protein (cupin superfamily)
MNTPSQNPFSHTAIPGAAAQPNGATRAPAPRIDAAERVERVEHVDKPWGHEEVFAVSEGKYVGKILHITAGGVLSLQMHRSKDETVAVQHGEITLEHGPDVSRLDVVTLGPGDRMLIPARVVHRITAVTDSRVLEASTAHQGWRDDVVRFEDAYGRKGTSAP